MDPFTPRARLFTMSWHLRPKPILECYSSMDKMSSHASHLWRAMPSPTTHTNANRQLHCRRLCKWHNQAKTIQGNGFKMHTPETVLNLLAAGPSKSWRLSHKMACTQLSSMHVKHLPTPSSHQANQSSARVCYTPDRSQSGTHRIHGTVYTNPTVH